MSRRPPNRPAGRAGRGPSGGAGRAPKNGAGGNGCAVVALVGIGTLVGSLGYAVAQIVSLL